MSAKDVSVFDILRGRYREILNGADLKGLAMYLAKSGIVSDSDLQLILASDNQREVFAQVLAQKGSAGLVECRVAIDKFKLGVQPTVFTNIEWPGVNKREERSGNGDRRQLTAIEELRSASPRSSSTGIQRYDSAKSHTDTALSVRNFVALFSALLHHLTDALYCGEMNWLLVDIPLDQVTSYLPKEYQEEGVVSQVSLSNLLEAFREECVEREELSGATKRKESKSLPPVVHSNREDAELQLVETTEALKRSEERNLQLVRVTQEWAEECRESENMVASLQRQLKALEGERDTLLTKYSRAKHMLSAGGGGSGGGGGGGGVGRGQFEEMRNEMSERKGINDKPISSEMTRLQEENRRLKVSVRQLEENTEELNRALMETRDELLAARLNLQELQELKKKEAEKPTKPVQYGRTSDKSGEHRYPKPVPRTQAMVTGYTQRMAPPYTSRSPIRTLHNVSQDATPTTSRSTDNAPPTISRSPDDDPSSTEHYNGCGNQIATHPASPHPTYPIPPSPPSPQALFPRSRSPHHSPVSKPHASLEVPIIRPHRKDDQGAVPVPQAGVVVETERKCPSCQHIFYTLGEKEFQSHVAGCFK